MLFSVSIFFRRLVIIIIRLIIIRLMSTVALGNGNK